MLWRGKFSRVLPSSVRARSTAMSVVAVGAALSIGGVALVALLSRSLDAGVEAAAHLQAANVITLLKAGELPSHLPPSEGGIFVQVVSASSKIVSSSTSLEGNSSVPLPIPALWSGRLPSNGSRKVQQRIVSSLTGVDEDPFFLLAVPTTIRPGLDVTGSQLPGSSTSDTRYTVVVAVSLAGARSTTSTVMLALGVGLPVLVMLVGLLTWILTGRALRPVEAIRAEVAEITGKELSRRVVEPQTDDEIGRLARTMNSMLARLERSSERQRRFVSDASHELRSPLAAMHTELEVSLVHPSGVDWAATAQDLLDEAERMQRVVNDLLLLARADESGLLPRREDVDLDEIVLAEVSRLRARGVVSVNITRLAAARVAGNADWLARMVRNLIENAERHAAMAVTVGLSTDGSQVQLVVEDDGAGIPVAHRERIFERFTRLDEARSRDAGGSGLGLAIVSEIVAVHGGSIEVADATSDSSRPGARFVVRFMRAPPGVVRKGVFPRS